MPLAKSPMQKTVCVLILMALLSPCFSGILRGDDSNPVSLTATAAPKPLPSGAAIFLYNFPSGEDLKSRMESLDNQLNLSSQNPYVFLIGSYELLEAFWQAYPEERQALKLACQQGKAILPAATGKFLYWNMGSEALGRELGQLGSMQKSFLGLNPVLAIADTPPPQTSMLSLLGQQGIQRLFVVRPSLTGGARSWFFSTGPGSKLQINEMGALFPLLQQWAGLSSQSVVNVQNEQALDEIYRAADPDLTRPFLLFSNIGQDVFDPTALLQQVAEWNKLNNLPGVALAGLDQIPAAAKAAWPSPKTSSGPGLTKTAGIEPDLVQFCEGRLLTAEKFATLAWVVGGRNYPRAALDKAWRTLWLGAPKNRKDLLQASYELSQEILANSLQFICSKIHTANRNIYHGVGHAVVVFNPSSSSQGGACLFELSNKIFFGKPFLMLDRKANQIPYKILEKGPKQRLVYFKADDVPALGCRVYYLVPTKKKDIEESSGPQFAISPAELFRQPFLPGVSVPWKMGELPNELSFISASPANVEVRSLKLSGFFSFAQEKKDMSDKAGIVLELAEQEGKKATAELKFWKKIRRADLVDSQENVNKEGGDTAVLDVSDKKFTLSLANGARGRFLLNFDNALKRKKSWPCLGPEKETLQPVYPDYWERGALELPPLGGQPVFMGFTEPQVRHFNETADLTLKVNNNSLKDLDESVVLSYPRGWVVKPTEIRCKLKSGEFSTYPIHVQIKKSKETGAVQPWARLKADLFDGKQEIRAVADFIPGDAKQLPEEVSTNLQEDPVALSAGDEAGFQITLENLTEEYINGYVTLDLPWQAWQGVPGVDLLNIEPVGQSFYLRSGEKLPVRFKLNASSFLPEGKYSVLARIFVEGRQQGTQAVEVTVSRQAPADKGE